MRNVNVDQILKTINPLGAYQWKQLVVSIFPFLARSFQGLNLVFIGHRPGFHCKPSPNDSLMSNVSGIKKEYRECEIVTFTNTSNGVLETSTPCVHGWDYDAPVDQSFVTEWDFVCQNAGLGELTQVLYQLGMLLGTIVFPTISDRFGRKPVAVLCHIASFGLSLGTAFSGNYVNFLVLRLLTGFFQQGMLAGVSLCVEDLPTELRHYAVVFGLLLWTTFICLMSPIAYALRNFPWKYLQMTYAMCSVWSIFQWWMLEESLRWVIANGQIDRAKEIIKRACKWNRKNYNEVMENIGWGNTSVSDVKILDVIRHSELQNVENLEGIKSDTDAFIHHPSDTDGEIMRENEINVHKYTVFDIFKHKRILIVSMILWYIWICDSFVYYGLYMSSSALYGDRYINFFLTALVEYPASLVQYLLLARIGRKVAAVNGHIIAAVCLAVATALTSTAGSNTSMLAAATAFTLIGKFGITAGYNSMYLATIELYPTNMRNIGVGVCALMEKVGSMVAPFSRNASSDIKWVPQCVFAIMCLIAVLLLAFIPETHGVELPQTIEELGEWFRVNKFELKIGKNRYASKKKRSVSKD